MPSKNEPIVATILFSCSIDKTQVIDLLKQANQFNHVMKKQKKQTNSVSFKVFPDSQPPTYNPQQTDFVFGHRRSPDLFPVVKS